MSLFRKYFLESINEQMSVASVGLGGSAAELVGNSDFYAPDDTRIPKVIGAKKRKKKKKAKVVTRTAPETIFLTVPQ